MGIPFIPRRCDRGSPGNYARLASFVDESEFDAIVGVVRLNFYWSGPMGPGEKHAEWRCHTPTEIVGLLERAGLRFANPYQGLSKTPYKAEGPKAGGRLVAVREG